MGNGESTLITHPVPPQYKERLDCLFREEYLPQLSKEEGNPFSTLISYLQYNHAYSGTKSEKDVLSKDEPTWMKWISKMANYYGDTEKYVSGPPFKIGMADNFSRAFSLEIEKRGLDSEFQRQEIDKKQRNLYREYEKKKEKMKDAVLGWERYLLDFALEPDKKSPYIGIPIDGIFDDQYPTAEDIYELKYRLENFWNQIQSIIELVQKNPKGCLIVPLRITDYRGSHANYLIFDHDKKRIFRLEPHAGELGKNDPIDNTMRVFLKSFLEKSEYPLNLDEPYEYIHDFIPESCPLVLQKDDSYCVAWSFYLATLYLLNLDRVESGTNLYQEILGAKTQPYLVEMMEEKSGRDLKVSNRIRPVLLLFEFLIYMKDAIFNRSDYQRFLKEDLPGSWGHDLPVYVRDWYIEYQTEFCTISDELSTLFVQKYASAKGITQKVNTNNKKAVMQQLTVGYCDTKYPLEKHDIVTGRLLILCHPREYKPGQFFHFLMDSHFEPLIKEEGFSSKVIDTVDIVPGGTFVADGFSESFINQHLEEYDIVFIPDCAGPWWDLQKGKQYDRLNKKILDVSRMVRSGGLLWISKFLYTDLDTSMKEFLINNGFDVELKQDPSLGSVLVARKK